MLDFALFYYSIKMFRYWLSQRTIVETKGWDVFRNPPPKTDSGSMANQKCLEGMVKVTKVFVYLLVFVIVLGSGVVAKGTILFMTSQLNQDRKILYCNRQLGDDCINFILTSERGWLYRLIFRAQLQIDSTINKIYISNILII